MDRERLQGPETASLVAAQRGDEQRRAIVDVFILALLALTAATAVFSAWFTVRAAYPNAARDLAGTLGLLAVLGVGWRLNRRGLVEAAVWLCLIGILVGMTFFFDARVLDRVLVAYALPVVAASFLLRPRAGFVYAGLCIADYIAVWSLYRDPVDFNYFAVFALAALALLSYVVASRWSLDTELQEEYRRELEREVAERERAQDALRAREQELDDADDRQRELLRQMVGAMTAAVELHDPAATGHLRRVAQLSEAIGRMMDLRAADVDRLALAAVLHDVGMTAVPEAITSKAARLTPAEYDLVKRHPDSARPVLARLEFGAPLADIVSEHHERLDGSGYPRGIAGPAISREARIIAVADTAEAMMSVRPYRPARGMGETIATLRAGSGTLYDERVVAACERVFEQGFSFEA